MPYFASCSWISYTSPEHMPRLFQAFEQADASTTRKFSCTGIGLTIIRQFAGLMKGAAGVTSASGQSSTFWFNAWLQRGHGVMPAATENPNQDAETQLRQLHGGKRVLLAEDNAVNREVALELLHGAGLAVEVAHWHKRLDGVVGLDVELWLSRVRGNMEGYNFILTAFRGRTAHQCAGRRRLGAAQGSGELIKGFLLQHRFHGTQAIPPARGVDLYGATVVAELAVLVDGVCKALKA